MGLKVLKGLMGPKVQPAYHLFCDINDQYPQQLSKASWAAHRTSQWALHIWMRMVRLQVLLRVYLAAYFFQP